MIILLFPFCVLLSIVWDSQTLHWTQCLFGSRAPPNCPNPISQSKRPQPLGDTTKFAVKADFISYCKRFRFIAPKKYHQKPKAWWFSFRCPVLRKWEDEPNRTSMWVAGLNQVVLGPIRWTYIYNIYIHIWIYIYMHIYIYIYIYTHHTHAHTHVDICM